METTDALPAEQCAAAPLGSGQTEAFVLDPNDNPLVRLDEVTLVSVAARGVAFRTRTAVPPGALVRVMHRSAPPPAEADEPFAARVLECQPRDDGRYQVRCRVAGSKVPANLLQDWSKRPRTPAA